MDKSEYIFRQAMNSLDMYGDVNPKKMAENMEISFNFKDFPSLLGLYTIVIGNKYIFVKTGLSDPLYRMTGFHEIGHSVLHDDLARKHSFQEMVLFDMKSITEYEVNAFASHILIDNDSLIADAKNGFNVAELASMYNVNINMMLIKFQELRQMGYDLRIPMTPNSSFLANVKE